MVINGTWAGHPITLSVKSNCLTISLEQSDRAEVVSYDYSGRLWTALCGIYAFLDGFSAGKKSPGDYRALDDLIYISVVMISGNLYIEVDRLASSGVLKDMRPTRTVAHFAAVFKFADVHRAAPLAPGTLPRWLRHQQAALSPTHQAYISIIPELTGTLTPGASLGSILDNRHYHGFVS